MTQSLSNMQNGVATRSQRRSGQVAQPPPLPAEVNAREQLAAFPPSNEDFRSQEAVDGTTLPIAPPPEVSMLNLSDFSTRHFMHSVAAKLPILQDNPSALQVATWLDTTVKIFCSDLPEAGSNHFANMLLGKLPYDKWGFLVQEGLTTVHGAVSFDALKEILFRCISGPSFVHQLENAYNALEQGAAERPSEFLHRLTNLHQYLLQFGHGRLCNALEVNTLLQKSNETTRKFLNRHLIQMQDSQQVASFQSCKEFLAKNEAAIARKYDQQQDQDVTAPNPCDINYMGTQRDRFRRNRFKGHIDHGVYPHGSYQQPHKPYRRRGHWQQRRDFQRRPSFRGRRPYYNNGPRQHQRYQRPYSQQGRFRQQAMAVTDQPATANFSAPTEASPVSSFWSMQPSTAICSVPGNKGAIFLAHCGSHPMRIMLDTGCNTDLPLISPSFVKNFNLKTTPVENKRFTNVLGEPGPVVNQKCDLNVQYQGFSDNKPVTLRETLTAFVHPCAQVDMILNLRYAIEKGITLHHHAFSYQRKGQHIQIPFLKQNNTAMTAMVDSQILSYEEVVEQADTFHEDLDSYGLICITQADSDVLPDQSCVVTNPAHKEDPMEGMIIGTTDPRARQILSQNADYIRKDRLLQLPPSRGADDIELALKKGARPPKLPWLTIRDGILGYWFIGLSV